MSFVLFPFYRVFCCYSFPPPSTLSQSPCDVTRRSVRCHCFSTLTSTSSYNRREVTGSFVLCYLFFVFVLCTLYFVLCRLPFPPSHIVLRSLQRAWWVHPFSFFYPLSARTSYNPCKMARYFLLCHYPPLTATSYYNPCDVTGGFSPYQFNVANGLFQICGVTLQESKILITSK